MTAEKGEAFNAPTGSRSKRFEHLDMLRGIAALLVLIGHVRGFIFLDYSQLGGAKLPFAPLYLISSLGHQAVMLFFALSGYLVGGRALREIAHGQWNLPDYAVHRFSRLWTALIPALIATALLDWVGRDLLHLTGYEGRYSAMLASGPLAGDGGASDTLDAFVGNIFFLQGIIVPVFGTNGPLWSLSNEFWYYFVVPSAWLAIAGRNQTIARRTIGAVFALAMLAILPFNCIALGSIWIIGACAWMLADRVGKLGNNRFRLFFAAMALATVCAFAVSWARPGLVTDLVLGIACAGTLPCLARLRNPGGLYGRMSFGISEISFTLYVVHFPLIALLWFAWIAPVQFAPGLAGFATAAALIAVALAFATAMWWLFERNTGRVRRAAAHLFGIATR